MPSSDVLLMLLLATIVHLLECEHARHSLLSPSRPQRLPACTLPMPVLHPVPLLPEVDAQLPHASRRSCCRDEGCHGHDGGPFPLLSDVCQ